MNISEFKKQAFEQGVKVYTVRNKKNSHCEYIEIKFAFILSENAVSVQEVKTYVKPEYSLETILSEWI